MTKTKTKKTYSPFDKAPKGKARVHLLIGVTDKGETFTYEPSMDGETMDEAKDRLNYDHPGDDGDVTAYYHATVDVAVPKSAGIKKAKGKAKKIGVVVKTDEDT